ncbi:MAG: NADH-quinone oxidoreductase subunit L [Desulfosarcinaceae bacterium]|nr:NADH-quinone oxidoreductase subunit L [Desulfosarcinaceae bacterium]
MMSSPPIEVVLLLAVALGLPLTAFGVIMTLTRSQPRVSAIISLGAIAVAFGASLSLLIAHWGMPTPLVYEITWLVAGELPIPLGVLLDPTSLLMLTVVAAISLLVQIYSLGYMAGDPGFGRYYGCMSLFAWAMLTLTVSSSLIQLYIFWELVGLASYLLIGFWFEKWTASEAGKKAFVMTRLGDTAFLLGLILLWLNLGDLSIAGLNDPQVADRLSPGQLTLAAVLIFGGIIGKSAQFPLLTWLPDAMEGPTPVSALLHSATMVAAGVYLFARLFGFFSLSPAVMTLCLAVGTLSMLLAASMALVSRDIKQVWAYSTISQLGYMLMGLGAGGFTAGVFHLTTHAGFKALLFLCAGVLIHHFDTNDIFRMSQRGSRRQRLTLVCLVIGAAALSGLPPLSGFFSKEMILAHLAVHAHPFWLAAGLLGSFLTAYYTFRLIFVLLRPAAETPSDDAEGHHHSEPFGELCMAAVLVTLAGLTVVLGFGQGALTHFLSAAAGAPPPAPAHHLGWLPVVVLTLTGAAIVAAWWEFARQKRSETGWVDRFPTLATLFARRWYLDDLYRWLLDRVVYGGFSRAFTWNDQRVIDGGLDGLGQTVIDWGAISARLNRSQIQFRLMVLFAVVAVLVLYLAFA